MDEYPDWGYLETPVRFDKDGDLETATLFKDTSKYGNDLDKIKNGTWKDKISGGLNLFNKFNKDDKKEEEKKEDKKKEGGGLLDLFK